MKHIIKYKKIIMFLFESKYKINSLLIIIKTINYCIKNKLATKKLKNYQLFRNIYFKLSLVILKF